MTTAAASAQHVTTTRSARSDMPVRWPRPWASSPKATTAASGAASQSARRDSRPSWHCPAQSASTAIARTQAPTLVRLAPACTRSAAVGVSYGGNGQPGLQVTAPETAASAPESASRAATIRPAAI